MKLGYTVYLALLGENLFFLALVGTVLNQLFAARADFIDQQVFTGTGYGCVLGLFAMAWLGRQQRARVTALPVAPSRTLFILLLLGIFSPVFRQAQGEGWSGEWAAWTTWQVGSAIVCLYGLCQILWGIFGPRIRWERSAALGTVAGVALVGLTVGPMATLLEQPYIGLPVVALLLLCTSTKLPLPLGLPPAFLALGCGVLVGLSVNQVMSDQVAWTGLHLPQLQGFAVWRGLQWLNEHRQLLLPLGAILLQGILLEVSLVESAISFEDPYVLRQVLVTLGLCNLLGGLLGACVPCTIALGHSAYKRLSGGSNYVQGTAWTLLVILVLGIWRPLVALVPEAALAGLWAIVLVLVLSSHLERANRSHPIAFALAMVPVLGNLLTTRAEGLLSPSFGAITPTIWKAMVDQQGGHWVGQVALGAGAVATGLVWGSIAATWVEGRLAQASWFALGGCLLSALGLMHSNALAFNFGPVSAGYLVLALALHVAYVHELAHPERKILSADPAPETPTLDAPVAEEPPATKPPPTA